MWFWRSRRVLPHQRHVLDEPLAMGTVRADLFDDGQRRCAYESEALVRTAHLPRSIMCPISSMPLVDPVIAPDGHSYERSEIVRWLRKKRTSPVTGEKLRYPLLIPNHALRNTIGELVER